MTSSGSLVCSRLTAYVRLDSCKARRGASAASPAGRGRRECKKAAGATLPERVPALAGLGSALESRKIIKESTGERIAV